MRDCPAETDRLQFRPWTEGDVDAVIAIYRDPDVVRFIGGTPITDAVGALALLGRNATWQPPLGVWAALEGDEVVGCAIVNHPRDGRDEPIRDVVQLGWHLGRTHWGRGLATEMGWALVRHGFDVVGADVLHACVEPGNQRSVAVALRLGFEPRGRTTAFYGMEMLDHVLGRKR